MADEAGEVEKPDWKTIRVSGRGGKLPRDPLKDPTAFRRFLQSTTNEKIVALRDEAKRWHVADLKRRGISESAALEVGLGWYGCSKDEILRALYAASDKKRKTTRRRIRVQCIDALHDVAKRAQRALVPEEVDRDPSRYHELRNYVILTRCEEGTLVSIVEARMNAVVQALQTEEARRVIRDDDDVDGRKRWIDILTYCSAVTRDAGKHDSVKFARVLVRTPRADAA